MNYREASTIIKDIQKGGAGGKYTEEQRNQAIDIVQAELKRVEEDLNRSKEMMRRMKLEFPFLQ